MTHHRDLRPYVACRAHGAMRFLDRVQGGLEDIEGAVAAGQFEVAALQARAVALACLSIHSLAHGGELAFDSDDVAFDFFGGVSPEAIAEALALANEATQLTERTAGDWLERFRARGVRATRQVDCDNRQSQLHHRRDRLGVQPLRLPIEAGAKNRIDDQVRIARVNERFVERVVIGDLVQRQRQTLANVEVRGGVAANVAALARASNATRTPLA